MTQTVVDEVALREPRLLVPGLQPLGPVKVDVTHPFGRNCKAFYCASRGPVNLVNGEVATNSGLDRVPSTRGNRALDFASDSCYGTVANVTVPFVLCCRIKADTLPGLSGVAYGTHLTKDTGLTTIAGIQIGNTDGVNPFVKGQNYDGTDEVTGPIYVAVDVWYDVFYVMVASEHNVCVNGVDALAGAASWTSGPNRISFGFADWGGGAFDGKVEWWGYWSGAEFWEQRLNNSPFRLSPYEMLIPA